MTYISSLSLTSPLRASILQAQTALTQAQTEVATGAPADLGMTLGAGTGHALSLTSSIDTLNAFTQGNSLTSARLSSTATVLSSMLTTAQTMSSALTTASNSGNTTSGLAGTAQGALQGLIAGLNTSTTGQAIFGGLNTTTSPVADYFAGSSSAKAAVDAAFQSTFGMSPSSAGASSISGSAMQSFLSTQFAALFNNSNWQSNWSSASSQTLSSTVSPSQTVSTSVSANQGTFQTMAQAYVMLTEFTGDNMSADAKSAVVSAASTLMNNSIAGLTNLQTQVGITQNTVDTANTQIGAQVSVLTTNVNDLEGVDTYALSTRVTNLQTQLEASYELTSRLQQLSLVNYLTGG